MKRNVNAKPMCAALGALIAVAAAATEMYYKGDLPGGITNAMNYCTKANLDPESRCDRLPGIDDDIVIVGSDVTIDIDDGHFDFLKTIKGINLKDSRNFRCNLVIEQDQTMPCWIADYSGYGSWRTGRLVKKGAGDLRLCTNLTSSTTGGMRMSYDVQEGDLYLHPPFSSSALVSASHISVAEGCTVHAPSNTRVSVTSISGAGTFTNDATESPGQNKDLYIGGDSLESVPTVFSGRLRGKWYVVNLNGYTYFTGKDNDFTGAVRGYSSSSDNQNGLRAVGFVSYPETGVSSLGMAATIDNREGPLRLRYLGTEPVEAGRKITVNDTTVGPMTIDGGMWGGLTWKSWFDLVTVGSNVGRQQRVMFTGTNAAERCYFSGYFYRRTAANGTSYSFHVSKDGPGTWRFMHYATTPWRSALTVRDGTLEFETIAETNKVCALGYATECYDDVCDYTTNLTPVYWAWRLGDSSDLSVTGSLKYVGTRDMQLESRKTALAGAGRFRFGEGSLFKYSAGIRGLGTGEKSISFESASGATNVISGIYDGDGRVSVVKEGDGVTVLTGDLGFTGDLRAEAGELVLKDINNADYRYYRINFKENVSTSVHPGLEESKALFPSKKSAVKVTAFGLYDNQGASVFQDAGDTNISHLALDPGKGQLSDFGDMTLFYNTKYSILCGVKRLFGQNCAAGAVFTPTWKDGRLPVPDDPDTWYRVYLHLTNNAAVPVSWDMCYCAPTNEANYAMNVTALSIDASADGATWQEVAATNGIVHLYAHSHAWLSNPEPPAWTSNVNYPERQSHPNKFPLAATKQRGTYARPAPRSVCVSSGAVLRNESASPISVSVLKVDAAGMGSIDGFSFAESGVLDIAGADLSAASVDIRAGFGAADGVANIAGWTLNLDGEPAVRHSIASVSATGIRVVKIGFRVLIR